MSFLQADISTIARKTGITSATQLAKLVPKDADRGRVPDVEWWDAHIMANAEYPAEDSTNFELREGAVTKLIEHPIQMMPLEPRNQGLDSIRFIMLLEQNSSHKMQYILLRDLFLTSNYSLGRQVE